MPGYVIRRPPDWEPPISDVEMRCAFNEAKRNKTKDYQYGFDFTPLPDGKDYCFLETKNPLLYPFYRKVKDGDECLKKTLIVSGYTGGIALLTGAFIGLSAYTILPFTDRPIAPHTVKKMIQYGFPGFTVGAVYSSAVCLSSHLRGGASDGYNHFVGGFLCGGVFGTYLKNVISGWKWAFGLGIVAAFIKVGITEGFLRMDHNIPPKETGFLRNNYGILIDRPDPRGSLDQRDFNEIR